MKLCCHILLYWLACWCDFFSLILILSLSITHSCFLRFWFVFFCLISFSFVLFLRLFVVWAAVYLQRQFEVSASDECSVCSFRGCCFVCTQTARCVCLLCKMGIFHILNNLVGLMNECTAFEWEMNKKNKCSWIWSHADWLWPLHNAFHSAADDLLCD